MGAQRVYLVLQILELSDVLSIDCPDGFKLGYKFICGAYTSRALAEARVRQLEAGTGGWNLEIVPEDLIGSVPEGVL